METHGRSVAKAISWRILASLVTGLIAFVFTENLMIAVGIGSTEALAKIFLYWGHERVWDRIPWGRTAAFHTR